MDTKLKNLATCSPTEFFTQTVKVRHAAAEWFTGTNILNIRKKMPSLPENATAEEKQAATMKQARENALEIFQAVFEEHPQETIKLLALACFVEPGHADDYQMEDYLAAIMDMVESPAVTRFFGYVVRSGLKNISPA